MLNILILIGNLENAQKRKLRNNMNDELKKIAFESWASFKKDPFDFFFVFGLYGSIIYIILYVGIFMIKSLFKLIAE